MPTPPQLRTMSGRSRPGGHRRVIDRRERRALAPGLHVGRTEVRDHIEAERGRRARAVAELARQPVARPMQDRLAMQADQRDALARDRKPIEKRLDRRDMGVGDVALELGLRRLGFARVRRPPRAGAGPPASGRGRSRPARLRACSSPSLSISATSIPSIDVPLMTPIAVLTSRFNRHRFRPDWRRAPTARRPCRSRWPRARRRTGNPTGG